MTTLPMTTMPPSSIGSPKMEEKAGARAALEGQIPSTIQPQVSITESSVTQVAESTIEVDNKVVSIRKAAPVLDDLRSSASGVPKPPKTSSLRPVAEFNPEKSRSSAILPRSKMTAGNEPTKVEMSFARAAQDSPGLRKEWSASGPDGPEKVSSMKAIAAIVTFPESGSLLKGIPRGVRDEDEVGGSNSGVLYEQSHSAVSADDDRSSSYVSISTTSYATVSNFSENPLVMDESTSSYSAEIASKPKPTACQCAKSQWCALHGYVRTVKDMYRLPIKPE